MNKEEIKVKCLELAVDYNQKGGCSVINIEPTEELIRKVLSLSDEADKAFKEGCRLFIGATIDERLDNLKRQQAGLLLEERIRFIKGHWKDFYYLQHIRSSEGLITIKI